MLTPELKKQLEQYLQLLENDVIFKVSVDDSEHSRSLLQFIQTINDLSSRLSYELVKLERTPSFTIDTKEKTSGIIFAGVPLGHEFESFVLAMLQVSGRRPKIDEAVITSIQSITQPLHFETYVSLSCHNCPDVVQALNSMSVLNTNITHTMIEGSMYQDEIESKGILAVPTIYLNGKEFSSGRTTIEKIVGKVVGSFEHANGNNRGLFDVLVVGGGPAGASAAIYAARKGIKTGLVADVFGGQLLETLSIENLIGTKSTDGPKLSSQMEQHVFSYNVDVIKDANVQKLEKQDTVIVTLENGDTLQAKAVVLATGARWKHVNVPGELEFKNKGVVYCPHCDGPLFTGKDVIVIGGGNSGVEAAIDLAGIAKKVTLLEFAADLKADEILQKRLFSLVNVDVITSAQTKSINGKTTVESLTYIDRLDNTEHTIEAQGVFVQIGLQPNTEWLDDSFIKTAMGELVVNAHGETSVAGVFAAGDCTDSAYKQIIIAMGSGATAALGAFDYIIRNT